MARGLFLVLLVFGFLFLGERLLFYKFHPLMDSAYWLVPILSYGFLFFSLPKGFGQITRGLAAGILISKIVITPFLLLAFVLGNGVFFNIALGVGAFIILSVLHGVLRGKYLYQVTNQTLTFSDLPAAFDGFKVLQISDIHSGSFDNPTKVAKGIELANKQMADVIVFTGDLINRNRQEIKPYNAIFSKLKAPMGVWSVLGNHDYYQLNRANEDLASMEPFFRQQHKEAGFDLLMDEFVKLEKEGQHIYLIGVQNWGEPPFPQIGDLAKAAANTEDETVRILLSHDPTHWARKVLKYSSKMHLTLSGHTHAMQFGINWGPIRFSPVQFRYKHWMGLYEEAGQYLYVNRGFGFHGFPGRVGMFPEITVFELRKGEA